MPASTLEPISSVLKNAFHKHHGGSGSSLESGLLSSAKKTLLSTTSVSFDPPVKHLGANGLSVLKKGTLIFLNPGAKKKEGHQNGSEEGEGNGAPAPPKPKIVFFPLHSVEVGYSSIRSAGAGMFNMGNTCYLNSTLQAMFHTPALFNYLMSGAHVKQCRQSGEGYYHSCIICAMTATLRDTLSSSVMRPNRIYEKLKVICKHLVHGRQEDAHEFLRYLIESLQRSFLSSCHQAPKNLDNASKETTPFNQIFGGYLRQDVTCMKCKHVSITFQHFMDVLLDIRQASTIEDALNYYFRAERIGEAGGGDGGNMYKCEKCKVKVVAKKKSFIARPPIVLCLQLKRFSLLGGKISKPVQLSRCIDVAQYVKNGSTSAHLSQQQQQQQLPPLKYKLVSMITHVGPSPNCGHYTAIGEAANGQFFQFDDSSVRPISVGQALNTASYVVFYEMTKATKTAWTQQKNEGETSTYSNGHHSSNGMSTSKTATSTATSQRPQKTAIISTNQPKMIPSGDGGANKLGVKLNRNNVWPSSSPSTTKKPCLVPYGDEDDSTSDDSEAKKPMTNGHSTPQVKSSLPSSSPFVPRSVTINALKRGQDKSPSISPSPILPSSRPSSSMSNDGSVISHKSSSSGVWKITDNDLHNPSVHSDNSTGSTSTAWKVTSDTNGTQPQTNGLQKSSGMLTNGVKIQDPSSSSSSSSSTPTSAMPSSTHTASSSLGSTPEKRSLGKRGSSMEEYEAELDRGKTKKVKNNRHSGNSNTFNGNGSNGNPFQDYQNKSYSNGHHHPHYNNHYRRSSSSNNQYSNSSSSSSSSNYNRGSHHRDHSYHANGDRNRGGSSSSSSSSSSGGGFRRSYSSSSLNNGGDQYRDRHRGYRDSHSGSGGRYSDYDRGHGHSRRDHFSDRNRKFQSRSYHR